MKQGVSNLLEIEHSIKGSLELATFCDYYLRIAENGESFKFYNGKYIFFLKKIMTWKNQVNSCKL